MSRPEFRKCPQRHPISGVPCERRNSHRGHDGDHLTFDGATWDTWRICQDSHPDHPLVSCALPWGHTGAHESTTGRIAWAATL